MIKTKKINALENKPMKYFSILLAITELQLQCNFHFAKAKQQEPDIPSWMK
jgi:hypothetical protein